MADPLSDDFFEDATATTADDAEPEEPEADQPEPEDDAEPEIQAEAPGDTPAAPPAATPEEPKTVPISAILDERDKRQAAQREAEELRRWKAEREARDADAATQAQRQAPPASPYAQAMEAAAFEARRQVSQFYAEREFGPELVKEAFAFFERPENHAASQRFLNSPMPFVDAVEAYRRHKAAEEIGQDPEAWRQAERERIRAELAAEAQAAAATAPVQTPPRPRPPVSLATAPSATRAAPAVPRPKSMEAFFED